MIIKEPITDEEMKKMFIEAFSSPYTERLLVEPLPKVEPTIKKKLTDEEREKILEEAFNNPEKLAAMERTIVEPMLPRKNGFNHSQKYQKKK